MQKAQQALASDRSGMLRYALYSDSFFCATLALGCIVGANALPALLGFGSPVLFASIGAIVVVWAAWLFFIAHQQTIRLALARIPLYGNCAWVVGTIIILLSGWLPLTSAGMWILGLLAVCVAGFAFALFLGIRQVERI
ncbi:MAG: hypothetical protein AAGF95_33935 [Chloroflexota bacterium]